MLIAVFHSRQLAWQPNGMRPTEMLHSLEQYQSKRESIKERPITRHWLNNVGTKI